MIIEMNAALDAARTLAVRWISPRRISELPASAFNRIHADGYRSISPRTCVLTGRGVEQQPVPSNSNKGKAGYGTYAGAGERLPGNRSTTVQTIQRDYYRLAKFVPSGNQDIVEALCGTVRGSHGQACYFDENGLLYGYD